MTDFLGSFTIQLVLGDENSFDRLVGRFFVAADGGLLYSPLENKRSRRNDEGGVLMDPECCELRTEAIKLHLVFFGFGEPLCSSMMLQLVLLLRASFVNSFPSN